MLRPQCTGVASGAGLVIEVAGLAECGVALVRDALRDQHVAEVAQGVRDQQLSGRAAHYDDCPPKQLGVAGEVSGDLKGDARQRGHARVAASAEVGDVPPGVRLPCPRSAAPCRRTCASMPATSPGVTAVVGRGEQWPAIRKARGRSPCGAQEPERGG